MLYIMFTFAAAVTLTEPIRSQRSSAYRTAHHAQRDHATTHFQLHAWHACSSSRHSLAHHSPTRSFT